MSDIAKSMEYNFQYLMDLYDRNNKDTLDRCEAYELTKIIDAVDDGLETSTYTAEGRQLFYLVPVLYSLAFISGITVMLYKLME